VRRLDRGAKREQIADGCPRDVDAITLRDAADERLLGGGRVPPRPRRETLDIDSMDFLNWVTAIYLGFGTDIPERDYAKLAILSAAAGCLASKVAK
jgi:hypothetical protein